MNGTRAGDTAPRERRTEAEENFKRAFGHYPERVEFPEPDPAEAGRVARLFSLRTQHLTGKWGRAIAIAALIRNHGPRVAAELVQEARKANEEGRVPDYSKIIPFGENTADTGSTRIGWCGGSRS
jgi:hypothetical protein